MCVRECVFVESQPYKKKSSIAFNVADDVEFKNMIQELRPGDIPPSRKLHTHTDQTLNVIFGFRGPHNV